MEVTSSSWETQLSCFLHAAVRRVPSTQSYTLTTKEPTETLILAQRALNTCSGSRNPCGYNYLRSLVESWVLSHRRYCGVSQLFLQQFTLLNYNLRRLSVYFQVLFGMVGNQFWTEESNLLQICVPAGNSPKFKRGLEKRFNVCRVQVQFWLWLGTAFVSNSKNSVIRGTTILGASHGWYIFLIPLEIPLLSTIQIVYSIRTVPIQDPISKYSHNFGMFHIWIVFSSLNLSVDKDLPNY